MTSKDELKKDVYTFGAKAIAYGMRMKVLEQQGRDHLPDFTLNEIQEDMNKLEQKIYYLIDTL